MQSKEDFYEILKPIYPFLAQQFVDEYGLMTGKCIDLGTGLGFVGIEIAKITNMEMYFVDVKEEQLEKTKRNFEAAKCDNEAHFVISDVHDLVFDDNFADFIVSRGSLWFWSEPAKALQEAHRVLKPGKKAVIGGGLGKYLPETMRKRILEINKKRLSGRKEKRPTFEEFQRSINEVMLGKAALPNYRLIGEDLGTGKWVEISK